MAEDLRVYNHLNYNENTPEKDDGFVEFIYQNYDLAVPEIDENRAWNQLNKRLNRKSNSSFTWMKIAASIAIIAVLSVTVYLYSPAVSQVHVASTDTKLEVTFPDGSTGILNVNSAFTYPEEFGDERNVSFTGEAYFDIKKSTKPFIIDVNGVDVKVLGTAFNLVTTAKEVMLYVDHGLVAFEKEGVQTKVAAGKEAIFKRADASIEIKDVPSENIMSWRNGVFNFNNTPIKEALAELSEYYNVNFKLENDKLEKCRISVTFENESLKGVLKSLSTILDAKTELKNKTVKISGSGC